MMLGADEAAAIGRIMCLCRHRERCSDRRLRE
jgi:hypothetical protein